MGSKRTLVLLAALVIGVIAAGALYFYVNGVENRALKGQQPVLVWVASQNIAAGTAGDAASRSIVQKKVPIDVRPASAITDPSAIVGKVARINLVAGQVVVAEMFAQQTDILQSTFADRLGKDRVALTVSVDQVHGVAGYVQPGDHVTLMVTLTPEQAAAVKGSPAAPTTAAPTKADAAGAAAAAGLSEVQFLYQHVEVLAVGGNIGASAGGSATTTLSSGPMTFAVPPEAAARIALAGAQLYLSLEPPDYTPVSVDPVGFGNLFKPGVLVPPTTTTTTTGAKPAATTPATTAKG